MSRLFFLEFFAIMTIARIHIGVKKLEYNQVFNYYKVLVPFIHEILGENSEILLHDVSSPESSIIALSGNLSNRKIGGPLTDMALKQIKEQKYIASDYVANYRSHTTDGKLCRSSSYFIKDDTQQLIGMLCINILVSDLVDMRDQLTKLIGLTPLPINNTPSISENITEEPEKLGQNIDELMASLINSTLEHYTSTARELSISDKEDIIADLSDKGVFLLKGGVAEVAKRLEMSEPSIYRYMAKIK